MRVASLLAALVLASFAASPARAANEPDDVLPGKIVLVKPASLFKFVAKYEDDLFNLPNSGNDPTVVGGTLQVFDTFGNAGTDFFALPVQAAPLGWKGLGNPAGSKGFKYKGAGTPADPCTSVLVTPKVIKASCKGAGVTLTPPFHGEVGIVLTLGTASKRYCASFGGNLVLRNDDTQTKEKDADVPFSCPVDPTPPVGAVYVDTVSGNDGNPGTSAAPLKTISAGIAAVGVDGGDVVVSKGTYNESLVLGADVHLLGGYDASDGWSFLDTNTVTIQGGETAVTGSGATSAVLRDLNIFGASNLVTGGNAYGLYLTSSAVTLIRTNILAGDAGAGANGVSGTTGDNGGNGGDGNPGCENSVGFGCGTCSEPAGGPEGTSTCARTGGAGGAPGLDTGNGQNGFAGTGGTSGGLGGPQSGNGIKGDDGASGNAGTDGSGGTEFGTASITGYEPADGNDGLDGDHANGGGGGGGGGGGSVSCNSYGSSGGGGGGGGCGGTGAEGGGGGGGSFGAYLYSSSIAILESNITAGNGGNGGSGGDGGSGGGGGAGGSGGPYGGSGEQDDGGNGAGGGAGGNGGRGGYGGGGGGGPSIGVLCAAGSQIAQFDGGSVGTGFNGSGGTSTALPGSPGRQAPDDGCPPTP